MRRNRMTRMGLACAALTALGACDVQSPDTTRIDTVKLFERARADGSDAEARAMLAPGARFWFDERGGEGKAWTPGSGAWAAWDREFDTTYTYESREVKGGTVVVMAREDNEFYRLIDRAPTLARLTYFLDADMRLDGLVYAPVEEPGRKPDRVGEAKAWIEAHHPGELERLMPGGNYDPSRENAVRWRELLTEWRRDAGLPEITRSE